MHNALKIYQQNSTKAPIFVKTRTLLLNNSRLCKLTLPSESELNRNFWFDRRAKQFFCLTDAYKRSCEKNASSQRKFKQKLLSLLETVDARNQDYYAKNPNQTDFLLRVNVELYDLLLISSKK